jgi:hypothetical protein
VRVAGAATVAGSSAMPHLGQEPGPIWRTSGSIGQVYSTFSEPAIAAGAAACGDWRKRCGSAWNFLRHDGLQK